MAAIPITVFTGFLGAGKTSIILSVLARFPQNYKIVLLKNEFGDVQVDSKLAQQSSLTAVSEILNGCMCCVLVGQMQTALLEIRGIYINGYQRTPHNHKVPLDKFRPDRIIIECSGSAFPATLAFQIRQLERDTGDFVLDAIVTVVDAENFVGYEDTSPTAKMQASYSDIILINKWEHVSERALDIVMDHLHTLNDATPKIKCQGRNGVDPNLIFGLQSKLFLLSDSEKKESEVEHDEVETVTILRGDGDGIEQETLIEALHTLSRECVWRAKGFIKLSDGRWLIVNWAFGRYELKDFLGVDMTGVVRMTLMGSRGEVRGPAGRFAKMLGSVLSHPYLDNHMEECD